MKQLCYISFLAEGLDTKEVMKSIKEVSKIKNDKYGLTGLLIYSNEIFLQVLEGEEVNVDITYKIIQNDTRHFGSQILFEQENTERAYSEWSMKFNYLEKIDLTVINRMLHFSNEIKRKQGLSNTEIVSIFENFLKI